MLQFGRTKPLHWTFHVRAKMRQWGLSESRVKRVLHAPKRTEEGIAPKTVAMMQPTSTRGLGSAQTWKQEIWVMFHDTPKKRTVVSAWRYPGVTKPRSETARDAMRQAYEEYQASGER